MKSQLISILKNLILDQKSTRDVMIFTFVFLFSLTNQRQSVHLKTFLDYADKSI